MQAFRRHVLDVSNVEIEAPAIKEKTSVARWFLVIAVMQIDGARLGFAKKIVFYLCGPEFRIHMRLFFAQKTAVFGLNSNDPIHRSKLTHRIAKSLNEKRDFPVAQASCLWGRRASRLPIRTSKRQTKYRPVERLCRAAAEGEAP